MFAEEIKTTLGNELIQREMTDAEVKDLENLLLDCFVRAKFEVILVDHNRGVVKSHRPTSVNRIVLPYQTIDATRKWFKENGFYIKPLSTKCCYHVEIR